MKKPPEKILKRIYRQFLYFKDYKPIRRRMEEETDNIFLKGLQFADKHDIMPCDGFLRILREVNRVAEYPVRQETR